MPRSSDWKLWLWRVDRAGDDRAAGPVDPAGAGGARIGGDVVRIADPDDRAVDREHRGGAARPVGIGRARRWRHRPVRRHDHRAGHPPSVAPVR